MIKTGYIRRIDDLGRIVIPKEIRKIVFGTSYTDGKPMEIFTENGTVVLSPYEPVDVQIVRHGHWKSRFLRIQLQNWMMRMRYMLTVVLAVVMNMMLILLMNIGFITVKCVVKGLIGAK